MKIKLSRGIILVLFILNSCTKSNSHSSDIHLTQGLVAYYPFNGNANDSTINKLNGVIHGGVTFTSDVSGKQNSAAAFDGSTGYIIVPDNAAKFQTDAVSVSMLVNLSDITDRQSFINVSDFNDASGQIYGVGLAVGSVEKFQFGVLPNTNSCGAAVYDPNIVVTAANIIIPNKWYHVVSVFTDSLQEIFVNGVLNTAITRNFSTLNKCSSLQSITIGAFWVNDLIPVNGSLDEVRIYNRALNQDEINELAKPVK